MTQKLHRLAFRPRARLVSVLGEQLISDQAVGLIELVKNSYDADAKHVKVEITQLADPQWTTVLVEDDGCGMTLEDIREKWLSPAVDHKERAKHCQLRTPLGRLPIGEKGVGRFAVHQIGRRLHMITRAREHPEIVLEADWDTFDEGQHFLDGLTVDVVERIPELFTDDRTGTQLTILGARNSWNEKLLKKVHRTLRRLQSPLREDDSNFRIRLVCPEYPEYENIDSTDILEKVHYEFRAIVTADGQCDFEYLCRHPALPERTKSGSENLIGLAVGELQGRGLRSGPFWLNLYVWDRSKDHLEASGVSRKELDAQCGVSIFRDGLRILPYGEPGDDWLLLDQERIQAPAERVGNNQVIGLIQVDQSTNLLLRDKTSREGLIENEAFLDLRAMARAAIRLFTTYWKKDRPRDEDASRARATSLAAAKQVASAIRSSASDEVRVVVPASALPVPSQSDTDSLAAAEVGVVARTVTQKKAVEILIEHIDGAALSAREREERIERLLTLAATGLAAERVVHEFGRQVSAALKALAGLRIVLRGEQRAREPFQILQACLETLQSEFRILAPYEVADRAPRAGEVSVREASDLALTLNRRLIEDNAIEATVEGEDFLIRGRTALLLQVLDNLVHNACYWLATLPDDHVRKLLIALDHLRRRIVIGDTGPGIHEEAKDHLFKPFFSMKSGGTGLGLYISSEIMLRIGGRIQLIEDSDRKTIPPWVTGAVFTIEFAPGPEGEKEKTENGGTR